VLVAAALVGAVAQAAIAACSGVRPGALVEVRGAVCTLNFVFRAPGRQRFVGTAGHCVPGPDGEEAYGERSWGPRRGPVALDGDGVPIGRAAYAVLNGRQDFALIRLRRKVRADRSVCTFGGPTGVNADTTAETTVLHFHGNGAVAGELAPARELVAFGMRDPDSVFAYGAATPGDSGAGVLSDDGRAVGVLVTLGLHSGSGEAGIVGITRLAPQLQRAQKTLDTRLRLLIAPYG
jgi:hypothetical protein